MTNDDSISNALTESDAQADSQVSLVVARPMPKIAVTDRMLLLLGDMVDKQLAYMSQGLGERSSIGRFVSLKTGESVDVTTLDYPVKNSDINGLRSRKLLSRLDKNKVENRLQSFRPPKLGQKEWSALAWYEHPDAPNKDAVALVEAARPRLENLRADIIRHLDEPRLVASKNSYLGEFRVGVGTLYVIVGETAQNWRVQPWEKKDGFSTYDGMVVGHGKDMKLPKANVACIDVTPAQFAAMREATRDCQERLDAARLASSGEEASVLAPIRQRLANREDQLIAMLEDEMRDVVQGASPTATSTEPTSTKEMTP